MPIIPAAVQCGEAPCGALSEAPVLVGINPDVHIITEQELFIRVAALAPQEALAFAKKANYAKAIEKAAQRHTLDSALLYAVIHAESAFDYQAVSPAGAQGLMQLMPDTAILMNVKNPFDPAQNIAGGARYLKLMLNEFKDRALALAAYNAGPQNVIKYERTIPPFAETQQYVERVNRLYRYYRQEIGAGASESVTPAI